MKKFLACALALTLTSAMFASCGSSDDSSSSKAETTTTTTTAATTTEATTTTAAPESTADSTAASGTESEGEGAKDISEMPATLKTMRMLLYISRRIWIFLLWLNHSQRMTLRMTSLM